MIAMHDLQVIEGKPCVQDLKIAERLGFTNPYEIRRLIDVIPNDYLNVGRFMLRQQKPLILVVDLARNTG